MYTNSCGIFGRLVLLFADTMEPNNWRYEPFPGHEGEMSYSYSRYAKKGDWSLSDSWLTSLGLLSRSVFSFWQCERVAPKIFREYQVKTIGLPTWRVSVQLWILWRHSHITKGSVSYLSSPCFSTSLGGIGGPARAIHGILAVMYWISIIRGGGPPAPPKMVMGSIPTGDAVTGPHIRGTLSMREMSL